MKKLINLVALVMLVSVNVLTPFTYAGDEIVGNGVENVGEVSEISENIAENKQESGIIPGNSAENDGEADQSEQENSEREDDLLDIQNDGGNIDEIQVVDKIDSQENETDNLENNNETTEQEEQGLENEQENMDENSELEAIQEPITMGVISGTSVILLPGTGFNSIIKTLANGGVEVPYTGIDNNIQSFERVDEIPAGVTTGEISEAGSEYPVYAWFDEGTLYYFTQAETIQLNPDSSYMFNYLSNLVDLNISERNTSNVTNMNYIFGYCSSLSELDLSHFDTSNATNMGQMFYGCSNLTELDVSHFDTRNVTGINYMFSDCTNLTKLNLSNFDTSKMTYMWYIFSGSNNLLELDLSGWDFRKFNYKAGEGLAYNMGLTRKSSLKKLNLTNAKFQKSMYNAFHNFDRFKSKLMGF